jgi:hypothetical protein
LPHANYRNPAIPPPRGAADVGGMHSRSPRTRAAAIPAGSMHAINVLLAVAAALCLLAAAVGGIVR